MIFPRADAQAEVQGCSLSLSVMVRLLGGLCLFSQQRVTRLPFLRFTATCLRQSPPGALHTSECRHLAAPLKTSSCLTLATLKAICPTFFSPCWLGRMVLAPLGECRKKKTKHAAGHAGTMEGALMLRLQSIALCHT